MKTKNIIKKRSFKITPNLVNTEIFIHNGSSFNSLLINKDMVGHKVGEFFNTRKPFKFKKKSKN